MISVASLLNPANSELRSTHVPPSPSSTSSTPLSAYESLIPSRPIVQRHRMAKDIAIFNPGKTKGEVNFPPFEDLDDGSIHEIEKYHIYPLGSIRDCPRHIPYNSDKKSFLEKTGRESFEVFHYEFKLIGEEKTYTVMWDYNIGLVRITPFFKCCKYSKTTPAKMLNLNPGLKEITHSITGGALVAQGYWMPYSCAVAVCATFCAHISGALIPIFGPEFPSKCIPTSHQSYGAMVIEPSIIASATAEAEFFCQKYSTASPGSSVLKLSSSSPQELLRDVEHLGLRSSAELSHRLRLKRTFTNASMYTNEAENSDTSTSSIERYPYSPVTPTSSYSGQGWTPDNVYSASGSKVLSPPTPKRPGLRTALPSFNTSHPSAHSLTRRPTHDSARVSKQRYGHRTTLSYDASPWLSAIPRSVASTTESFSAACTMKTPSMSLIKTTSPGRGRSMRRNINSTNTERAFEVDIDREYDGEDDDGASPSGSERSGRSGNCQASDGMEKKAAWLLMNLSVRDGAWAASNSSMSSVIPHKNIGAFGAISGAQDRRGGDKELMLEVPTDFSPSTKRRRATSL